MRVVVVGGGGGVGGGWGGAVRGVLWEGRQGCTRFTHLYKWSLLFSSDFSPFVVVVVVAVFISCRSAGSRYTVRQKISDQASACAQREDKEWKY